MSHTKPRITRRAGTAQLVPILTKWASLLRKYTRESEGDAAFFYTERANVGVLAAAVWLCGGIALEEWNTSKRRGKSERKGRNDLYFSTATTEYQVEAKIAWIGIARRTTESSLSARINRSIDSAEEAVDDVLGAESDHRLAITFAIPIIKDGVAAAAATRRFLGAAARADAHFYHWAAVPDVQPIQMQSGKTRRFPGALLIGRVR